MTTRASLAAVRALHTAAFFVELASIGWLVLSGWLGRRDRSVAIAAGLVGAEGVVFVANAGICPLTPLAERLGARRGSVSDIFLPDAIARTIPRWSTALVTLGVVLHLRSIRAARRDGPGAPETRPENQELRRAVRMLAATAHES